MARQRSGVEHQDQHRNAISTARLSSSAEHMSLTGLEHEVKVESEQGVLMLPRQGYHQQADVLMSAKPMSSPQDHHQGG